jgi:hypothetical protein
MKQGLLQDLLTVWKSRGVRAYYLGFQEIEPLESGSIRKNSRKLSAKNDRLALSNRLWAAA